MTDPQVARRAASAATGRPHLLVVSADAGLLAFLTEGLVQAGFWVSGVAGAFQVLEVFRLRTFDLVLVDAAIGGIGAEELIRRLRGRSDRAGTTAARTDIPILVVAADEREFDAGSAADAGADGILVAPLQIAELAAELREMVDTWRSAHPDRPFADELAQARSVAQDRDVSSDEAAGRSDRASPPRPD